MLKFIRNLIFIAFQGASVLAMYLITLAIRPEIKKPSNLIVPKGTLIIANHQSWIDPWLVCTNIGVWAILKILPLRFPVTHSIFGRKIAGSIIWLFGGFDIGTTDLDKAKKLLYIRDLLHNKYPVLIFPEGKRVNNPDEIAQFQRGFSVLAREDVPLLLVKIQGMDQYSLFRFKKAPIILEYSEIIHTQDKEEKLAMILNFFNRS